MSRPRSVFAGHLMLETCNTDSSPTGERRTFSRMKTIGYLTGRAKKPNRWGIKRIDLNGSTCFGGWPCQHTAAYWLASGHIIVAHTCCAAELCAVAQLIDAKFGSDARTHLAGCDDLFEEIKSNVIKKLDAHFHTTGDPDGIDTVSTDEEQIDLSKKRSATSTRPSVKKHAAEFPQ